MIKQEEQRIENCAEKLDEILWWKDFRFKGREYANKKYFERGNKVW